MCSKFIFVCVLLGAPIYIDAATALLPYVEKPPEFADVEGCYISSLNKVIPYNDPYSPTSTNECIQYNCNTNNKTQVLTCGVIGFDETKCTMEQDYSKAYPCCCGTVTCGDSKKNAGGEDCEV